MKLKDQRKINKNVPKMNDTDQGIEKETSFTLANVKTKSSFLHVKYTLSDTQFRTQLFIFKGGPP